MTESEAITLLEQTDDFRLSDGVFCAAADLTNNKVDFDSEREPLKTVSMVWLASGAIDNGGFGYLLEYKCGNDRELRQIADAFRRVNAVTCAKAFDQLFLVFPNGRIIEDYDAKCAHFQSVNEDVRDRIDQLFYSESEEIPKLVARFIRDNKAALIAELTGKNRDD